MPALVPSIGSFLIRMDVDEWMDGWMGVLTGSFLAEIWPSNCKGINFVQVRDSIPSGIPTPTSTPTLTDMH